MSLWACIFLFIILESRLSADQLIPQRIAAANQLYLHTRIHQFPPMQFITISTKPSFGLSFKSVHFIMLHYVCCQSAPAHTKTPQSLPSYSMGWKSEFLCLLEIEFQAWFNVHLKNDNMKKSAGCVSHILLAQIEVNSLYVNNKPRSVVSDAQTSEQLNIPKLHLFCRDGCVNSRGAGMNPHQASW